MSDMECSPLCVLLSISIDNGKGGLETMIFTDVRGTSLGYGYVIDHMRRTAPRQPAWYVLLEAEVRRLETMKRQIELRLIIDL